jgi:Raf kinase inhibitor-like YbhB/YbcL family protein
MTRDEAENTDTGTFSVSSLAFDDGEEIPTEYTCEGANDSPPLRIDGAPSEAETFALVVDDPDAPGTTFVHWLLWNIPADSKEVPRGVPHGGSVEEPDGARQGTNDNGDVGYFGPCPPEGDGPHTYGFTLYAVDTELGLEAGAGRGDLGAALNGKVVGRARLDGTHSR